MYCCTAARSVQTDALQTGCMRDLQLMLPVTAFARCWFRSMDRPARAKFPTRGARYGRRRRPGLVRSPPGSIIRRLYIYVWSGLDAERSRASSLTICDELGGPRSAEGGDVDNTVACIIVVAAEYSYEWLRRSAVANASPTLPPPQHTHRMSFHPFSIIQSSVLPLSFFLAVPPSVHSYLSVSRSPGLFLRLVMVRLFHYDNCRCRSDNNHQWINGWLNWLVQAEWTIESLR